MKWKQHSYKQNQNAEGKRPSSEEDEYKILDTNQPMALELE